MLGKTEFASFQKVRQTQLWPWEYETEQELCFLTLGHSAVTSLCSFLLTHLNDFQTNLKLDIMWSGKNPLK